MISRFSRYTAAIATKTSRNMRYFKMTEADLSETPIPLYQSTKLHELVNAKDVKSFVDAVYSDKEAHQRYLRLVPFYTEALLGFHNKLFVIKAGLLPKAEQLKLDCMTNSGILTRYVELNNVIPVIWHDFFHANHRVTREMPTFIDPEMIYYNMPCKEFYLFDTEAEWIPEGVEHPVLQLQNRYNEKNWHDHFRVVV